jgi:hypothetical protein
MLLPIAGEKDNEVAAKPVARQSAQKRPLSEADCYWEAATITALLVLADFGPRLGVLRHRDLAIHQSAVANLPCRVID